MSDTKRAGANAESTPLNLRLPHSLGAQLEALATDLPIVSKHRLAVEALRLGLATIAADPSILIRGASTPSPRAPAAPAAPAPSRPVASPAAPVEAPPVTPPVAPVADSRQLPLLAPSAPAVALHTTAGGASVATVTGNDNAAPIAKAKRPRREAPAVVDDEAASQRAALVAERLRALRSAEGASDVPHGSRLWSLRPIADRAGISTAPVARLLKGERISPAMVDKLAAILPPE
jgi:hypothetical protein